MSRTIVVYDLGTNTFRWLAATVEAGTIRELGRGREAVGIGRSLSLQGQFAGEEIAVATTTLNAWRPGAGITPSADIVLATATHAFRAAANGRQVADELQQSSGIPIRIVDPHHEAELTFRGVATNQSDRMTAVLDIGGGSTELSWGEKGELAGAISLPIGVVTLRGPEHESLNAAIPRIHKAVDDAFLQVYNETPSTMLRRHTQALLISTCGTSSALTMEYLDLADYQRDILDGVTIPRSGIDTLLRQRQDWTAEDWAKQAAAGPQRATLMGPGIGVLTTFMDALGATSWMNSEAGLLEGALHEQIDQL